MNKWISVKNKLPVQDNYPTYDWCLVTSERFGDEKWPIAFARYDDDGWDFFETNDYELECPVKSDYSSVMSIKEITHWMELPDSPK